MAESRGRRNFPGGQVGKAFSWNSKCEGMWHEHMVCSGKYNQFIMIQEYEVRGGGSEGC